MATVTPRKAQKKSPSLYRPSAPTPPSQAQHPQRTGFLDLPAEIRNEIYMLALTLPVPCSAARCMCQNISKDKQNKSLGTRARPRISNWLCYPCHHLRVKLLNRNVLRVSKEISAEATSTLYGHIQLSLRPGSNGLKEIEYLKSGQDYRFQRIWQVPKLPRLDLITQITQRTGLSDSRVSHDQPVAMTRELLKATFPALKTFVVRFFIDRSDSETLVSNVITDFQPFVDKYAASWQNYTIVVEVCWVCWAERGPALEKAKQLQVGMVNCIQAAFSRQQVAPSISMEVQKGVIEWYEC